MKYIVRHFRIGRVRITYAFSKEYGQYMYFVGSNAYKYQEDAEAYAAKIAK